MKTVNGGRSIERHPRAKNECGLEFSNALPVPGSNQRCGNPLFRRRQRCWTAPPSASSIPISERPCLEQVLDPLAARTDHIVLNAEERNTK